jgi:heme ABC exporter ATP-binding subunit CcmA
MLSAEGLTHAFGPVRALDGISFRLGPGQSLVIFGPNGAGKTTLLKVLAGLLRPQRGRVEVEGGRRAVGWISHQPFLYGHLTVIENLRFWASLYDVAPAERDRRARTLLGRLGIAERAAQPVAVLSRGLVQRVTIARALMHEPRVLLLDEPFTGLDLAAAAELRRLLTEQVGVGGGGGRIIVLATHNVEEGVELASDVAFQHHGRFLQLAPRGGRDPAQVADAYRRAVSGA